MNSLNPEIVVKTAALARLTLNENEQTRMCHDLGKIFALFEAIDRPDITALAPLGHPLGQHQRLREDIAAFTDMKTSIEQNAPAAEDGFITVPKVIE